MTPLSILIIKKPIPKLIIEDIVQTQQLATDAFIPIANDLYLAKEGDPRHIFGKGHEVFYGGNWIDFELWTKIKIKRL